MGKRRLRIGEEGKIQVFQNRARSARAGGLLIFRDYCHHDSSRIARWQHCPYMCLKMSNGELAAATREDGVAMPVIAVYGPVFRMYLGIRIQMISLETRCPHVIVLSLL